MLTRRERVHASIRRKGMDAIPWQFDLTESVQRKLRAHYGTEDLASALEDHVLFVHRKPIRRDSDAGSGLLRDDLGALWRREARDYKVGDWGELVEHPLHAPSLEGYVFPDGSAPWQWDHARDMRARNPDVFLIARGLGLFETGWALCGFQDYLGCVAGEEAFVEELTERLADLSCAVTRQLAGTGLDGIRFGDDWGFQDRLMVRPETWRRIYKKHYRRIYGAARDAGLVVCIHSCGNITDILPDLAEIGVQVVHPLQPESMDVERCRREYGRDLTFWGGLGSQSTLPFGAPEDVRREVRDRLRLFADGGYILAPAGAAPAETPVENIVAVLEEARAQLRSGS